MTNFSRTSKCLRFLVINNLHRITGNVIRVKNKITIFALGFLNAHVIVVHPKLNRTLYTGILL